MRLWAIIDVSESGVVRLNGPKTSPERTHPQPLSHSNGRSLFFSQSSYQNAPVWGEIWSKSGQIARNAQRSAGLSHLWVQMLGGSLLDRPPISGAGGIFTKLNRTYHSENLARGSDLGGYFGSEREGCKTLCNQLKFRAESMDRHSRILVAYRYARNSYSNAARSTT